MIIYLMLILPLICAALIYFVPDRLIKIANLAFALVICAVIFKAISLIGFTPLFALNKMLFLDSLGGIYLTIIGITGTVVTLYFPTYLGWRDESPKKIKKMLVLAYITTFAMILSAVANDIAIMWAAVEATTLSSVFMVVYNKKKQIVEAGYKYVMVCSLGLAFAMLATILLYSSGGILFTDLIDKKIDPLTMKVIFILALVGFGTKAGLALIRYYFIAANSVGMEFVMDTMLVSGVITLYVAGYFLVTQHDVKRMLAYHSVVHMGVIAFALGVGGKIGVAAALFHCLAHSLTKALAFLTTGNTWRIYQTNNMHKMGGLAYTAPLTCVFFGISICSLVGVPAFAIFVSEFMTFTQAILTERYVVAIIFAIALAVIFIADFSHFFLASFGKNQSELKYDKEMSLFENLPLIFLGFFVIAFGLWKFEFFWNLLDLSVNLIKDLR